MGEPRRPPLLCGEGEPRQLLLPHGFPRAGRRRSSERRLWRAAPRGCRGAEKVAIPVLAFGQYGGRRGWSDQLAAGDGGRRAQRQEGNERRPLLFGARLIEHELVGAEAEAAPQGAEAIVVPSETSPRPPAEVQVDRGWLYCLLCSSSLKPPIYQRLSHVPRRRRRRLHVPCHFAEYGCESFVPYFRSDEHRNACGHAPCHCPEPGFYLVCSPRALAAHLADHLRHAPHALPPGSGGAGVVPGVAGAAPAGLRLLRGDDASVFVVAAGPLGGGAAVSVVLVRASFPGHPRFACTFCAKPPPGPAAAVLEGACFFATVPVRSSALADGAGVAPEKELYFAVPGEMLCEGGSRELAVSVRIDRSCGPEPPLEDYQMITQN
ncbi:hypothetical protein PAHAL_5G456100 [Panicum hallii]|uniref:SIAH-type domain-containing protein n=1 Tax=Panicum hallii TaxID=206008 RepID=A0A2T8INF3_9POAL|nr:hypothetical protein PAHAL_5G456100 [Panicum hallii]